jgi:acid phosphatase
MVNDGHDSSVNVAGNWSRQFLAPLMNDTTFMKKTLVLLIFDENETYAKKNNIFGILLGDAIPASLRNTTDDTFYTHYSTLSTIQANWGLYHLGRGDVNTTYANVFQFVANMTGYNNTNVPDDQIPYFNHTAVGYFDAANEGPIPAVNTDAVGAGGRGVLPVLKGAEGQQITATASSKPMSSTAASGTMTMSMSASGAAGSIASSAVRDIPRSGGFGIYFFVFVAFVVGCMV